METLESLELFLRKKLGGQASKTRPDPNALTIGLEHEFFLVNAKTGAPATHEESQAFLKSLSKEENWQVRSQEKFNGAAMITRVSQEKGGNRFTALKYDHHPHLMEVALSYSNDLFGLKQDVHGFMNSAKQVSARLGLSIFKGSNLPISSENPKVISEHPTFQDLRSYRKKLFQKRGADPEHTNYAAIIAATQTHIGGTKWWDSESYVGSLYALEPEILYFTSLFCRGEESARNFLQTRWAGYRSVFSGYPLVGFPKLPKWTFTSWCEALLKSPLYGPRNEPWAGASLKELGDSPFQKWEDFFSSVRDLQIIRPRLFGTLEFRSDPAQPDADSIMAVAAMRLGLCAWALSCEKAPDFQASHDSWWQKVQSGDLQPNEEILLKAHHGLLSRNLGEEVFLLPFLLRQEEREPLRKTP